MDRERAADQRVDTFRATDLKGSRVVNTQGDRLGTMNDLTIELEDGVFSYAIIAAGGFLGIGGDLRPVPPEALQAREVTFGIEVVLDITEEEWRRAPTIEREQIHRLTQEARGQQIYQFYGQDWEARQERITEFAAPARGRDREGDGDRDRQANENREFRNGIDDPRAEVDQIKQDLKQAMTRAGVDEEQAEQEAERLSQQFARERPDQEEIERQLEQALTQAGVDQEQAEQEAEQLSGQIQRQIEFAAPDRGRQLDDHQRTQPGTAPGHEGRLEQPEFGEPVQDRELEHPPGRAQPGHARETGDHDRTTAQQRDRRDELFGPEALRPVDQINLASDLMDARIRNEQGEELGRISDFLVSLEEGRVGFALVTTATGFWEMTDDEYAVATQAFETRDNQLILNLTQQDLETAQNLTPGQMRAQLQEQAGISPSEARQSPQVFRYHDVETGPGVFGAPEREDRDRERDVRGTPHRDTQQRQY